MLVPKTVLATGRAVPGAKKVITECDSCKCICFKAYNDFFKQKKLHFCSRKCCTDSFKTGGEIHLLMNEKEKRNSITKKSKETMLKNHGVDNISNLPGVREKINNSIRESLQDPIKLKHRNEKTKQTCLKKYGVEHPFQVDEILEKAKQTMIKRYGVDCAMKLDEFKEKVQKTYRSNHTKEYSKTKQTCLKKYGAESPMQTDEVKEKLKVNNLRKHGVEYTFQRDDVKETRKQTLIKKYGVDNPLSVDEFCEKAKRTNLERYGVENPTQCKATMEKRTQTCLKKYGVEHASQLAVVKRKVHETMKRNGIYANKISKPEKRVVDILKSHFGDNDIEQQRYLNDWSIDVYIKSIDTYVQIDGTYWHGLDRSIELIKDSMSKRDRVIYETFLRDQKQIEWCAKSNIKLVRLTDKELRKMSDSDIIFAVKSSVK